MYVREKQEKKDKKRKSGERERERERERLLLPGVAIERKNSCCCKALTPASEHTQLINE
jgi:hypothetical protein